METRLALTQEILRSLTVTKIFKKHQKPVCSLDFDDTGMFVLGCAERGVLLLVLLVLVLLVLLLLGRRSSRSRSTTIVVTLVGEVCITASEDESMVLYDCKYGVYVHLASTTTALTLLSDLDYSDYSRYSL